MNYSYITATETKTDVLAWCRGESGELLLKKFPIEDYLYAYIPDNTGNPDMVDLFGVPMKKVSFGDKWKFNEWCKIKDDLCESDVPPVYKMILDEFSDAPTNAPYNILYYDIEVDFDLTSGSGYPTPKNPFGEINSFQAFDSFYQKYVMFVPEVNEGKFHLSDKEYPVEIHYVRNERDLLLSVASYIEHVDIMTGWYTNGFDLPYIMERAIYHFGEKEAKTMFCRNGLNAKRREFVNEYGEDVWNWTLVGREHLDMQELYKKFIPGQKESFSLDAVCEEDLGETKDDYDGDLGSLYRENPQAFFNYAKQDARLLKLLDDKHAIISQAMMLSRMNCVLPRDVTGAVKPIETGFIKYCHERGIVLPDKKSNEKEKFPGAIVYDTIAGRHGYTTLIDLNHLYPATMMMLGLSPETYIMQLDGEYDDYVRVMSKSSDIITITPIVKGVDMMKVQAHAYEVESLIRESGYVISASGAIFDGSDGLFATYVKNAIELRSEYRKLSKIALNDGDLALSEQYDLKQKVMKVVANSTYGVTGEASFRLYDIRLSKAITLTSRIISKWQASKSNDLINQAKELF